MKLSRPSFVIMAAVALLVSAALAECRAAELHVGGATVSITPDRPVALAGQMHTRIARDVESPATATSRSPRMPSSSPPSSGSR